MLPELPPLPDGYKWYTTNNGNRASVECQAKRLGNRALIAYYPEKNKYRSVIWVMRYNTTLGEQVRGWDLSLWHDTMEAAMQVVSNQLLLGMDDG